MKILVVEDEQNLRSYLASGLQNRGYQVNQCEKWDEVEAVLLNEGSHFDMIILDRMLYSKEITPIDIAKIKNRWKECGIIILSAIGTSIEKSKMLDAGVDDYMTKPFSIDELISRINAVHRRMQKTPSLKNFRQYANLTINFENQNILVNDKAVEFSRKEYLLLKLLLDSPSRVFSRHQLLDRVWDIHSEIESNVVEVTIKNIRKKLENANANIKILSRRNVGYWAEV